MGYNFSVYIITNYTRSTLYIGMTNDLTNRLLEHYLNRNNPKTFAGRYNCHYLVYFEDYKYVYDAMNRENQLKKWNRAKKDALIESTNPEWRFLNEDLMEWPPRETVPNRY